MKLAGQRIVVTGAASGIGRALLQELLKLDDVQILAADLHAEAIPPAPRLTVVACDFSEAAGTDLVLQKARDAMGGVDIYFANAGFAYYETLGEANWQRIQRIYATNVLTPIHTFQKMRDMAAGRPFRVVVTASAMGYLPLPGYAIYGATKASLVSFTEALRWELPDPCALTLVNPIATRTKFFTHESGDAPVPFPSQTPEHVARAALRGVLADRRDIFPSLLFRVTLILHRLVPLVGWIYQNQQQGILRKWSATVPHPPPSFDKSA